MNDYSIWYTAGDRLWCEAFVSRDRKGSEAIQVKRLVIDVIMQCLFDGDTT